MSRLVVYDLALGPPGTRTPDDFTVKQGLRLVLPSPSRTELSGPRVGLRVTSEVTLLPASPLIEVLVEGYAGAEPPEVRIIAPDGTLIAALRARKGRDDTFEVGLAPEAPIGRVDLTFPAGEGTLYALSGISGGGASARFLADDTREASGISESVCQAIIYAETGTLEVAAAGLPELAEARRFIGGVAYKRKGSGVAKPKYPTPDELKQPFIKRAWERCLQAAKDSAADDVGDCKHFVIWYSDDEGKTPSKKPTEITDKWPYEQTDKISAHWGPYKANELNADNIYVIKYCGVP